MSASLFYSFKNMVRPRSASLLPRSVRTLPFVRGYADGNGPFPTPKEYKVLLDHQTLYISQELAEALGWQPTREPVQLTLNGWEPMYFTITPTGTDSDRLARSTVESGQNKNVQEVLERLK